MTALEILPIEGMPEVRPGDDVAELIAATGTVRSGDVLVARMLEGDPEARPFDILEWQATLAEGANTARETQVALKSRVTCSTRVLTRRP